MSNKHLFFIALCLIATLFNTASMQAQVRQINMTHSSLNTDPMRAKEGLATLYVQAESMVRQGRYEEAIMVYNDALAWDPYDVETLMRSSALKYRIGRYAEARQEYQTAQRINPFVAELFNFQNQASRLNILAFEPEKYLLEELDTSQQNEAVRLKHKVVQKKLEGDILGALADVDAAIELKPEGLATLYKLRGNLYLLLEKYFAAEDDYSRALQLEPEMTEALHNRGIARLLGHKRLDACQDFQDSHRLGYEPSGEPLKYLCSK